MSTHATALPGGPSLVSFRSLCFQILTMVALAGGIAYWSVVFATSNYDFEFVYRSTPVQSEAPTAPKLAQRKFQDRILPEHGPQRLTGHW